MEERLRQEAQVGNTRLRPPPSTSASPTDRNLRLTRTPLRKAIALLLYRPELAQQVTDNELALRDDGESGVKLLANLVAVLRANPQLTTAALLERYRNTSEGAILERLATWEPGVPEQDYQFEQEFSDILASLGRRDDLRERLPEMLLRRGTPRALSAEEREALRNLGKAKKV
jgi:DNA primase